MANKKYTIHAGAIGSATIPGISGQGVEHQVEQETAAGAGDIHPRGQFSVAGGFAFNLRSRAIKTVLSALTLDSTVVTPSMDLSATGKDITLAFALNQANNQSYEADGSHISYHFDKGFAWLTGIDVGAAAIPSVSLAGLPVSTTGQVDAPPYTIDTTANLLDLPDSRELYRLASVSVDGTALKRWTSWSLQCEPAAMPLREPGDFYATGVLFGGPAGLIQQRLSIGSEELDVVYSKGGAVGAELSIVSVFKPLSVGGALSASNNITVTCRGSLQPAAPQGEAFSTAEDRFELTTRFDGTNQPTSIVIA